MIKILLYGGCHALVLRDLFETLFDSADVELQLLINFHLIASAQPFPYERLNWCDVFIYSPIENKGEYNTDLLLERCHASDATPLCFPWMEWHGYCPGAVKGVFKGRFQWYYPALIALAERFERFGPFMDHVVANFPANDVIDQTFAVSGGKLASSEARHEMPVRISGFIETFYRSSRLFMISDHPSLILYLHVLDQISERVGLRRRHELQRDEPQWRWRTPILPKVAERLRLSFTDTGWVDDELIPNRTLSLETYLGLYFHQDSVILGPVDDADLRIGRTTRPVKASTDPSTRIVASPLAREDCGHLDRYLCRETLSGPEIVLPPNAEFEIDKRKWRSTWDF